MVFTRLSSRLLFIRTSNVEVLTDFLLHEFESQTSSIDKALMEASEDSSVVFLTKPENKSTNPDEAEVILHVEASSSAILMALINEKKTHLLESTVLGPGLLVMRLPEQGAAVVELLKNDYEGQFASFEEGLSTGDSNSTLIAFTDKAINRYMVIKNSPFPYLLVKQPVNQMQRNIRRDAVRYITGSLKDKEWYEYRINIYDSYGRYKQHLERLMLIINELELGFALGERWTKDHALVLYSVTAYQVRIFSMLAPEKFKLILVGLEFDSRGKRFVDLDLYYRSKKVEFSSLDMEYKKGERSALALSMRDKILSGIGIEAKKDLDKIEAGLLQS
ncbi:hypothetical protein MASR2M29_22630 [Spirochaetota bacterium]